MSIDLHTLSGAYALNALSPEEVHEFCKHFDDCPSCQQEVGELQEAAAKLGASEAVRPPAHLKPLVLSAADRQPQFPPRIDQTVHEQQPQHAGSRERRTPNWFPRLLAAAAVILVAGVFGVSQVNQEPEENLAAPVSQVFAAEDASTKTSRTDNGGTVSVATSPSLGKMAVDTDELPALDEDQVYQMWTIAAGTPESAGVLEDPSKGAAMDMPSDGVLVAITIEPAGGSEEPTGDPIVSLVPSAV